MITGFIMVFLQKLMRVGIAFSPLLHTVRQETIRTFTFGRCHLGGDGTLWLVLDGHYR